MPPLHVSRPACRALLALSVFLSTGFNPLHAQGTNEGPVPFVLKIPAESLPAFKQTIDATRLTLTGDPSSVADSRGLPLLYIAAGALIVPDLAQSLVAVYRNVKNGGTVIEVRDGKLLVTHDIGLDGDTIVIKHPDGKVTIEKNRSGADLTKWIAVLTSLKK